MSFKFRYLFIILITLGAAVVQAESSAEIVYAEGEGFTIVRKGQSLYYDLYESSVEGMILQGGDLVLTEESTWVEIQIGGSATLIKIAENTTFTLKSLQNEGGIFKVSYGRVRARVEKLIGDTPFWMEGADTVAGVRGTDFGYDLFYDEASPEKKNVSVYCFDGKVEVVRRLETPEGEDFQADSSFEKGKENTSTVILRKNEMVSVYSEDRTAPLDKKRIQSEVKEFWEINDFNYEPAPEAKTASQGSFQTFHNDADLLRRGALYSSITGALIVGAGLTAYWGADDINTGIGLSVVGSSLITAGGYFLIRSLIIP
ncbi:FecR domain-containing protein [Oceanispirochaeta sp.]|uniref:FecR domain-containing protein n=1 Tax=Oceanispirochaeta sp. TaxID=2035350 RepID=UPI00261A5A0F|nr:FecR domain-containing protein [Oceanispirochaeta sp.]MDA3956055.1 FecR domain-containing protein [Oceanispirochaeta sp.]